MLFLDFPNSNQCLQSYQLLNIHHWILMIKTAGKFWSPCMRPYGIIADGISTRIYMENDLQQIKLVLLVSFSLRKGTNNYNLLNSPAFVRQ